MRRSSPSSYSASPTLRSRSRRRRAISANFTYDLGEFYIRSRRIRHTTSANSTYDLGEFYIRPRRILHTTSANFTYDLGDLLDAQAALAFMLSLTLVLQLAPVFQLAERAARPLSLPWQAPVFYIPHLPLSLPWQAPVYYTGHRSSIFLTYLYHSHGS